MPEPLGTFFATDGHSCPKDKPVYTQAAGGPARVNDSTIVTMTLSRHG